MNINFVCNTNVDQTSLDKLISRIQRLQSLSYIVQKSDRCYMHHEVFNVGWGRPGSNPGLNTFPRMNKLQELTAIEAHGIPTIPFSKEAIPLIRDWFNTHPVWDPLPILFGRRFGHEHGSDIYELNTDLVENRNLLRMPVFENIKYWTVYLEKKAEYRVHVFRGEAGPACRRIPNNSGIRIWTQANSRYDYTETVPEQARQIAINAVKAVKLDFGAVDLLEEPDGTLRVLEVNRAPRIRGGRLRYYAEKIVGAARQALNA